MIKGAKYWNDRGRYYSQVNNPTEEMLRKQNVKGWLETCGPTSAVNCLAALGHNLDIRCPGPYKPQPEEVLSDFLNDPASYTTLRTIRTDIDPASLPGNRVPQYYQVAVAKVFDVRCLFIFTDSFDAITSHLEGGSAVQLCLKSPGHYIAAVAYDREADEIIFNDSWPGRFSDGNGFNRRISRAEYAANVRNFANVFPEVA